MTKPVGEGQRHRRLLAGGQLHHVERSAADRALDVVGEVAPEPQKIWRMYSAWVSESGSCAAIRRTRGLTVKVTSIS